ncbi:hypothetical protein G9A89_014997 [Geosiphon pyriformis]|nr:hypothetical protein G9A89_014997 [Geosiphon pyriformis]
MDDLGFNSTFEINSVTPPPYSTRSTTRQVTNTPTKESKHNDNTQQNTTTTPTLIRDMENHFFSNGSNPGQPPLNSNQVQQDSHKSPHNKAVEIKVACKQNHSNHEKILPKENIKNQTIFIHHNPNNISNCNQTQPYSIHQNLPRDQNQILQSGENSNKSLLKEVANDVQYNSNDQNKCMLKHHNQFMSKGGIQEQFLSSNVTAYQNQNLTTSKSYIQNHSLSTNFDSQNLTIKTPAHHKNLTKSLAILSQPTQVDNCSNHLTTSHQLTTIDTPMHNSTPLVSSIFPIVPASQIQAKRNLSSIIVFIRKDTSQNGYKFRFVPSDTKEDIKQEIRTALNLENFSLFDDQNNIITGNYESLEDGKSYMAINRNLVHHIPPTGFNPITDHNINDFRPINQIPQTYHLSQPFLMKHEFIQNNQVQQEVPNESGKRPIFNSEMMNYSTNLDQNEGKIIKQEFNQHTESQVNHNPIVVGSRGRKSETGKNSITKSISENDNQAPSSSRSITTTSTTKTSSRQTQNQQSGGRKKRNSEDAKIDIKNEKESDNTGAAKRPKVMQTGQICLNGAIPMPKEEIRSDDQILSRSGRIKSPTPQTSGKPCSRCRDIHRGCDRQNPCKRCIEAGKADSCNAGKNYPLETWKGSHYSHYPSLHEFDDFIPVKPTHTPQLIDICGKYIFPEL